VPPCRAASCRSVHYLHPTRAGRWKAITASHPVFGGRLPQLGLPSLFTVIQEPIQP